MKVVIAGGTGFLGQPLAQALADEGRDVVVLTRAGGKGVQKDTGSVPRGAQPRIRYVTWDPSGEGGAWTAEIDGAAVVNLAGESIGARRWSAAQKQRIIESRVQATRALAHAIRGAVRPAAAFDQRIGRWILRAAPRRGGARGPRPRRGLSRARLRAMGIRSDARSWRRDTGGRASEQASRSKRTAARLPRMLTPFKLGVGGPLGSGRQYWPWIHRADWIALVRWAIDTSTVSGAINATAPHPVTNADFTKRSAARCTGPLSCRRLPSRYASHSEKWPMRCCCPGRMPCRRRPNGWDSPSDTRISMQLSRLSSRVRRVCPRWNPGMIRLKRE